MQQLPLRLLPGTSKKLLHRFVDIPFEVGGLCCLQGSNRLPGFQQMRQTYGEHDTMFDDVEGFGPVSSNSPKLLMYDEQARWMTASYRAGDILIFTMKTLHGSLENQSESTVRLSIDCRWQPAAEPIDPRYITDDEWNKARGIDIPPGTCAHESESLKANSLAAGRRAQKKTRDMFQAKKDWGLEH